MFFKMEGYYFKDKEKEVFCIPYLLVATKFTNGDIGLNYNPNYLEELILASIKGELESKIRKQQGLTRASKLKIIHISDEYGKGFMESCYGPPYELFWTVRRIFDFIEVNYKTNIR